jgi:hypothetical protein
MKRSANTFSPVGKGEGIPLHDVWALNILQWLQQEDYVEWFQLASVCHLLYEWIHSLKCLVLKKYIPYSFSQFSLVENLTLKDLHDHSQTLGELNLYPLVNLVELSLYKVHSPFVYIWNPAKLEELCLSETGVNINLQSLSNLKKLTLMDCTFTFKALPPKLNYLVSSSIAQFVSASYTGRGIWSCRYMDRYDSYDKSYEGEWKDGQFHGEGLYTNSGSSNEHYRGMFKKGRRNGWGREDYGFGKFYEGEWVNDLREGKGKLWKGEELIYDGEWVGDLPIDGPLSPPYCPTSPLINYH